MPPKQKRIYENWTSGVRQTASHCKSSVTYRIEAILCPLDRNAGTDGLRSGQMDCMACAVRGRLNAPSGRTASLSKPLKSCERSLTALIASL
jgi:hypothetical protein